jgi:hypothetical protein
MIYIKDNRFRELFSIDNYGNIVKFREVLIVEPKFSLSLQRNHHTLYSVSHSKEQQESLHDVTWLSEAVEIQVRGSSQPSKGD